MREVLIIVFGVLLIACQSPDITYGIKNTSNDSLYVVLDSSEFNPGENIVKYKLFFNKAGKKYLIHSIESQDGNTEMVYKYVYSDANKNFECIEITDFATGINWLVLKDNDTNSFFLTDPFNLSATGDTLVKESVDFEKAVVKIKSGDEAGKIYSVKLNKIVPKGAN